MLWLSLLVEIAYSIHVIEKCNVLYCLIKGEVSTEIIEFHERQSTRGEAVIHKSLISSAIGTYGILSARMTLGYVQNHIR
jgi:hypothetical protein